MPPAGAAGRESDRLEAFSDGVLAVIITIMVLELKVPASATFHALAKSMPGLLVYILSFAFVGIYWNNHHHLLRSTEQISASVMWANLHLLFWISLIPVVTEWVGKAYSDHLPASTYGFVGLGSAIAYWILVRAIIRAGGADSEVARRIGSDLKGILSVLAYAGAIALAWITPWISYALFVAVAVIWFVPDRRLEAEELGKPGDA